MSIEHHGMSDQLAQMLRYANYVSRVPFTARVPFTTRVVISAAGPELHLSTFARQAFTLIFTLECIAKLVAMTKHYFNTAWNIFDFVIVFASLVDLGLEDIDGLSVFRGFRLVGVCLRSIYYILSPASYLHITCILPAYYLHITCILPAYYLHITCILPAYYLHITCILPAYYLHITCILPAYYLHITCILPAYYLCITCILPAY